MRQRSINATEREPVLIAPQLDNARHAQPYSLARTTTSLSAPGPLDERLLPFVERLAEPVVSDLLAVTQTPGTLANWSEQPPRPGEP